MSQLDDIENVKNRTEDEGGVIDVSVGKRGLLSLGHYQKTTKSHWSDVSGQ